MEKKKTGTRGERIKIQAAGNGSGGVLIVGCCALIAAGIGAAFAARRARNRGKTSNPADKDRRIGRAEDAYGEEEKIVSTKLHQEEKETESFTADLSFEIMPNLEKMEIMTNLEAEVFDQEEEIMSVELEEEETESSSEAEGEKGEEGSEGTGPADLSLDRAEDSEANFEIRPSLEVEVFDHKEYGSVKLHEEESESSLDMEGESSLESSAEQVWPEEIEIPEVETPGQILDIEIAEVETQHIFHMQGDSNGDEVEPMVSEEVMEPITEEDETFIRTGASVTELRVAEQEEVYPEEKNQDNSIQSSRAFADCIRQGQVLANGLEGVKMMVDNSEVDTDTDTTEIKLDTNVKDDGSLAEELGSYHFDTSSKSIKSAEHEMDVPVKEEDVRGEEGSQSNDKAIHPAELMDVLLTIDDMSRQVEIPKKIEDALALAETEYDGKTSAALEKFIHYNDSREGEFSVDSSAEIQAVETLVTQNISKNSEMVMELGAKMDNDDCITKEFSTIGVVSFRLQDQEKSEVIQESLEKFQEEEKELFCKVGRGVEELEVIQDSSVESRIEKKEELLLIEPKNAEQVETPKSTDDTVGTEIQAIETLVTQNISKNSEMVMELGAKMDNDDRIMKEFSTIGVVSYTLQDQERSEVIQESLEKFQEEEKELFCKVGRGVEELEVIQDSSMESRIEGKEELLLIEPKNAEQVEAPKNTDDTVGTEQAKEEHGDIQENSMGSSEEKIFLVQEKQSSSIDLENIEQVETAKKTDDMFGIEQVEDGDGAEDEDVVQDSSIESSAEEIFPDEDKELPSIDLKNIQHIETVKRTDDAVGIEQDEEEHNECEQKVASKVVDTTIESQDGLLMSSNYRVFILLLLALGLALGLLTFAQPDSLRYRDHRLPEMYHKLYQLFFRSCRAVADI